MKHTILIVILFFGICNIGFSQSDPCEEVAAELEKVQNNFSRVDIEITKNEVDSLTLLIPEDCNKSHLMTNVILGRYKSKKGKLDSAMLHFNIAYQYILETKSKSPILRKQLLHFMANIEDDKGNYSKTLLLRDSAIGIKCITDLKKCQKFNLQLQINSSITLQNLDRFQEAIDILIYTEEQMTLQGVNDSMYRVSIFNSIGNIYESEYKDLRQSLLYHKKALNFIPVNHVAKYLIYNNIGDRYAGLLEQDSAKFYFTETIQEVEIPRYVVAAYLGLGKIELENKKYKIAKEYFLTALEKANSSKHQIGINGSKGLLIKALYLNGNYAEANKLNKQLELEYSKDDYTDNLRSEAAKYRHLIDIAAHDSKVSMGLYNYFLQSDSLNDLTKQEILEESVSKYEKLLLKDSLDKAVLLKINEEQKVSNYRLSTAVLAMGLFLLGCLVYQFRSLFLGQREKNEELVFKNKELESINLILKKKAEAPVIPTVGTGQELQTIQFKSNGNIFILEPHRIKYAQAEDDGTRIFYDDTSNWTDTRFKEIRRQLEEPDFIQIFRGTIVNVAHIAWVNSKSLKLKDKTELKIGRTYKKNIIDAFEK